MRCPRARVGRPATAHRVPGLRAIVAATKQWVAPSSSGTSVTAAARRAWGRGRASPRPRASPGAGPGSGAAATEDRTRGGPRAAVKPGAGHVHPLLERRAHVRRSERHDMAHAAPPRRESSIDPVVAGAARHEPAHGVPDQIDRLHRHGPLRAHAPPAGRRERARSRRCEGRCCNGRPPGCGPEVAWPAVCRRSSPEGAAPSRQASSVSINPWTNTASRGVARG